MKLLLFIPIIGSLIISILPTETPSEKIRIKQIALTTSILTFIQAIYIWIGLEEGTGNIQLIYKWNWYQDIGIVFGIDGISIVYILLTVLIIPICILASWDSIKILEKQYWISILVLEAILIAVFSVLDILGFYICFEAVLIPMFIIIGIWGAREEKITASYYFFFYTLIGSVLFLISIIYIYKETGTTDYNTILGSQLSPEVQNWIFLAFFASLAVKIPKFPFHIWLPLAHVEAPLAGSIILAGILIKLGSYGFIRYALPILPDACVYYTPLVYTLAVLGIIFASLTTIRQTDLKRIIAYSSVSHMAVVMLSIFTLTAIGIEGSIFLQVAHGIVSSALFIVVTILYDRHHTRVVKYYRGMTITMPIFSSIFFFFTLANIAVPLSCNFIGEFVSLLATFESNPFIAVLASSGMILSACYSLFLYNRVAFGTMSPYVSSATNNRDVTRREFYLLTPLIILTILLGIFPNIVFQPLHSSILSLLSWVHP